MERESLLSREAERERRIGCLARYKHGKFPLRVARETQEGRKEEGNDELLVYHEKRVGERSVPWMGDGGVGGIVGRRRAVVPKQQQLLPKSDQTHQIWASEAFRARSSESFLSSPLFSRIKLGDSRISSLSFPFYSFSFPTWLQLLRYRIKFDERSPVHEPIHPPNIIHLFHLLHLSLSLSLFLTTILSTEWGREPKNLFPL